MAHFVPPVVCKRLRLVLAEEHSYRLEVHPWPGLGQQAAACLRRVLTSITQGRASLNVLRTLTLWTYQLSLLLQGAAITLLLSYVPVIQNTHNNPCAITLLYILQSICQSPLCCCCCMERMVAAFQTALNSLQPRLLWPAS